MSNDSPGHSMAATYKRLMLQKAVELSQRYGGLKKIPADVLLENGIKLRRKGRTTTLSISLPSTKVMKKRIASLEAQVQARVPIAKEIEQFKLSPESMLRSISQMPATMEDFWIEQGWYKVDKNGWRLTRAKWEEETVRRKATRFLVEQVLQKNPKDISRDDFESNRLRGLLPYYSNSPYEAVSEAFPELEIKPWEMSVTPNAFYKDKKNRVDAVRWLVKKLGKKPKDIIKEEFYSNRLGGLLINYYSGSPYEAFLEAGLVTQKDEEYMRQKNKTTTSASQGSPG